MKKNIILLLLTILTLSLNHFATPSQANTQSNVSTRIDNAEAQKTPQERIASSDEKIAEVLARDPIKTVESLSNTTKNFSEVGVNFGKFVSWLWPSEEQKARKDGATRTRQIFKIENELNQCLIKNKNGELDEDKDFPTACKEIVEQFLMLAGRQEYIEKLVSFKTLPK